MNVPFRTTFQLIDGEAQNREHPMTFHIPPEDMKRGLQAGSLAKIGVTTAGAGERFWVEITRVEWPTFTAKIRNDLVRTSAHGLSRGDSIAFEARHILAVDVPPPNSNPNRCFGPIRLNGFAASDLIPIPVGEICPWCEEPIGPEDSGVSIGHLTETGCEMKPHHVECFVRSIAGSVGHQLKLCSCYGGTTEDPEGVTVRQAAKQAFALFNDPDSSFRRKHSN